MTGAIRLPRTYNDRVAEQRVRTHALSNERDARQWGLQYYDEAAVKEAYAYEDYRVRGHHLLHGAVNTPTISEGNNALTRESVIPRRFLWDVGIVLVDGVQRRSYLVGNTVLEPALGLRNMRFEVCEATLELHRDDGSGRFTLEGEKALISNATTTPLVVYDRKLFDHGETGFVDAVTQRALQTAEYETITELLHEAILRLVQ